MKLFPKPLNRIFCLGVVVCTVLAFPAPNYLSQTPAKNNSASIAGRVTIAGKGVADVTVVATSATTFDGRAIGQAKTDQDGNYRIDGLPAGSFRLAPVTQAYALATSQGVPEMRGQTINVVDGEAADRVDFKLVRGGVITGRITDVDGNPVIGEQVGVHGSNVRNETWFFENVRNRTDDRGIYRIFGLAAGEYRVSIGQDNPSSIGSTMVRFGSLYSKTYYPGTTTQSEAKVLELKEGAELANVDFVVGRLSDGFAISGRVVDNTGQPVPSVGVGYARIEAGSEGLRGMNFIASTDADGRFRTEGLQPGKYGVFTLGGPTQSRTLYGELSQFEIVDADVTGIVITLRPGASISGVAIIENNSDPALIAGLQNVQLFAHSENSGSSVAPSFAVTQIKADGTFSLSGLSPGKVRIGMQRYPSPPKGFHLLRVELDGVAKDGIEVTAGAEIPGVRLVFNHGAGSLRGRVKLEGGNLPEGIRLYVTLLQPGQVIQAFSHQIEVDARGQFFADNISPGTYELKARGRLARGASIPTVTQPVTIAHDVETAVTIVLNLTTQTERP